MRWADNGAIVLTQSAASIATETKCDKLQHFNASIFTPTHRLSGITKASTSAYLGAMPAVKEESRNGGNKFTISAEDRTDLDALNVATDRLRAALPDDSYVLTIPHDVEPRYHHYNQQTAMAWCTNTPFQWMEGEPTQYQTWFYHETGVDMYVPHSSRPREEVEKPRAGTGSSTPSGGPKKKISLDTYKKKQNGPVTPAQSAVPAVKPVAVEVLPPVKQPAVKGPVERLKAETEQVLAAVPEVEDEVAKVPKLDCDKKELKRKRSDEGALPQKQGQDASQVPKAPVTKKARTSPPPAPARPCERPKPASAKVAKPKSLTTAATSDPEAHMQDQGLPPRLSPLRLADVPALPPRLSPTLPANIAASLEAKKLKSSQNETFAPILAPKNDLLTPSKKPEGVTKHKSPVPRNGFRANSSSPAVRSDVDDKVPVPTTIVPKRPRSPDLSRDDEMAIGKALKDKKQEKPKLIVKLKYRKHHREDIKRILKMRPRPDQPAPTAVQTASATKAADEPRPEKAIAKKRDVTAKGVAQKVGPTPKVKSAVNGGAKKPEDKPSINDNESKEPEERPAKRRKSLPTEEKYEPPAKRKKLTDSSDSRKDPSTPIQPAVKSPKLQSSTQRSQQVTPSVRKDHLSSVTLRREPSSDINAAETPSAKSTSTPLLNGVTSQPHDTVQKSSGQPSDKTPRQAAWEAEEKKLLALGRELKHAASDHLKKLSTDSSQAQRQQKLAAVKCVESLLAYFLAFTAGDEAAACAEPKQCPSIRNWRTLPGFFAFVKRNTEPYPLLTGLVCHLGVVFNGHLMEHFTLFPPREADNQGKNPALETYALLSKTAAEAEAKLDIDGLIEAFPRTWSGRRKGEIKGGALERPGHFGGPYRLPLSAQVSPTVAARAGFAMMREWLEGQTGFAYEMKLKLSP
ncbi:Neurofilament heavy polypeptide [Teratosphaeria destructans]|uniref:Neurofilament heavy polypeptide n=1 Tax=Teratosphaeria destructans TaxID=418781 RepID=A0A9W7W703_9PEZI|nr:Neurofilament heavy polypeptide [Teratosphaeria destructans]